MHCTIPRLLLPQSPSQQSKAKISQLCQQCLWEQWGWQGSSRAPGSWMLLHPIPIPSTLRCSHPLLFVTMPSELALQPPAPAPGRCPDLLHPLLSVSLLRCRLRMPPPHLSLTENHLSGVRQTGLCACIHEPGILFNAPCEAGSKIQSST